MSASTANPPFRARRRTAARRPLGGALAALVVVMVATGCTKSPRPYLDTTYSYNLAKLPPEWPGEEPEKTLEPDELKLYQEMGRPDIIRILYDQERTIKTRTDVDLLYKRRPGKPEPKEVADFDHSWLYIVRGYEVVIHPSGDTEQLPLTDELRTLYQHGDPQARTYNERLNQDTWVYYSKGKRFKFVEGRLVATERFTPMGGTWSN